MRKSSPSSRTPMNVMQSTEYRPCDNLAVGLPRSNLNDCRITGRTLTKRSMRTPAVEICDIRRNRSTQMALGEDEQVVEILGSRGSHPTLRNRIRSRRFERRPDLLNAKVPQTTRDPQFAGCGPAHPGSRRPIVIALQRRAFRDQHLPMSLAVRLRSGRRVT